MEPFHHVNAFNFRTLLDKRVPLAAPLPHLSPSIVLQSALYYSTLHYATRLARTFAKPLAWDYIIITAMVVMVRAKVAAVLLLPIDESIPPFRIHIILGMHGTTGHASRQQGILYE